MVIFHFKLNLQLERPRHLYFVQNFQPAANDILKCLAYKTVTSIHFVIIL